MFGHGVFRVAIINSKIGLTELGRELKVRTVVELPCFVIELEYDFFLKIKIAENTMHVSIIPEKW